MVKNFSRTKFGYFSSTSGLCFNIHYDTPVDRFPVSSQNYTLTHWEHFQTACLIYSKTYFDVVCKLTNGNFRTDFFWFWLGTLREEERDLWIVVEKWWPQCDCSCLFPSHVQKAKQVYSKIAHLYNNHKHAVAKVRIWGISRKPEKHVETTNDTHQRSGALCAFRKQKRKLKRIRA